LYADYAYDGLASLRDAQTSRSRFFPCQRWHDPVDPRLRPGQRRPAPASASGSREAIFPVEGSV